MYVEKVRTVPTLQRQLVTLMRITLVMAWLYSASTTATGIELSDPELTYRLNGVGQYLIDETGQMSFDDVKALTDADFHLMPSDHLSLGYQDDAVWLKFSLLNSTHSPSETRWVMEIDYPLLDSIALFLGDRGGFWLHTNYGDHLPFAVRPIDHRTYVIPIQLEQDDSLDVYMQVKTSGSMQIRVNIQAERQFYEFHKRQEFGLGIIYGIMLLMVLYNLFLYISVRDRTYLAYVFSALAGIVVTISISGHAFQYLWPEQPAWANTVVPLSAAMWTITTAIFTQLFLGTRKQTPNLHKALNLMLGMGFLATGFALFSDYSFAVRFNTALSLINGLLILVTGFVCLSRGQREARFFAVAWVIYQIGTAMLILSRFGLLPDNFLTHNSATLGLLIEIIMLSLALSDKFRSMTRQLESHAITLERQVEERTSELNSANQALESLSRQDDLTQLANRRWFLDQLVQVWQDHEAKQWPLALILCDVDRFKQINDHFGHIAGDDCLKAVADVINQLAVSKGYLAARQGGDEFALILPNSDLDQATKIAQQLIAEIRRFDFKSILPEQPRSVTLSLGVSGTVPGNQTTVRQLIKTADQALYQAKGEGRDGVVALPMSPDLAV